MGYAVLCIPRTLNQFRTTCRDDKRKPAIHTRTKTTSCVKVTTVRTRWIFILVWLWGAGESDEPTRHSLCLHYDLSTTWRFNTGTQITFGALDGGGGGGSHVNFKKSPCHMPLRKYPCHYSVTITVILFAWQILIFYSKIIWGILLFEFCYFCAGV